MNRVKSARLFSLATLTALVACSGGGNTVGGVKTGGDFVVLQTEPSDNGALFLNDAIRIDFSNPVDLNTVDLTTFSFQVLDQIGNAVAEPVAGNFALDASPGDATVGRRLLFVPRLPTNDSFTNGGFRPGRTYIVQLVGGDRVNGTVMRDATGKPLAEPTSFRFSTSDGTTAGQLFRNTAPGGPRRAGFEITPAPDSTGVVLHKQGAPPVEIRLVFDQPLSPSSTNVPVLLDTNPLLRNPNARGRVYLEYTDPELGPNTWIPADVELESNTLSAATVVLRPVGVLPNNATVRVVVEKTLEDISGESNQSNPAYDVVFGTFQTRRAYEPQFDAIVETFASAAEVDLAAAFSEPVADVGPGFLKAGFAFEGTETGVEFDPLVPDTILNTNFTQVVPKTGSPYNVSGGVFNFKNVTIGAGKVVRGQGNNPMVWLVSETFEVAGTLSVRGGDGTSVDASGSANLPKAGGIGACGGGDGGAGSPSTTQRDNAGGTGNGPMQVSGGGGGGGVLACTAGCTRGSGGGGGSMATQGDPNYKQKQLAAGSQAPLNPFPIFQQQVGIGGNGCPGAAGTVTRTLLGGPPGPIVFSDARADNNFWGSGLRLGLTSRLRITGELSVPVGGGGGGGGGDLSFNSNCNITDPTFASDSGGGGGGGGGGVLVVKALGPIIVRETGRIVANGGNGGGGAVSGSSSKGGGGGGGAGGMVVLMSATRIDIHAHGLGANYTYAQNNFDFSISADGGVCRGGTPSQTIFSGKYPATGTIPITPLNSSYAAQYDSAPLGGFGGMGIVQLMVPPGTPPQPPSMMTSVDGTNTILDDNIHVFRAGVELMDAAKQSMLAWRGFPNALGQGVDDKDMPTNIGDNEGDIRPSPLLLPTPFASKTRVRSYWVDTGFTHRRLLTFDDGLPRGVIGNPQDPGPRYEFAGVNPASGYATFTVASGEGKVSYPEAVPATDILSKNANSTYLGEPAYRVELVSPALGSVVDRYTQYEAELLSATNALLGSFRIYSHTDRELVLAAEGGALPGDATKVRIKAKFFEVVTNGSQGLGPTYLGGGGERVPVANVRIGFAFHQDPADPAKTRYPTNPDSFVYDLSDPAVQETIRALGMPFVQWDITFDAAFARDAADVPPALNPTTPRPELHFLRLPFRF